MPPGPAIELVVAGQAVPRAGSSAAASPTTARGIGRKEWEGEKEVHAREPAAQWGIGGFGVDGRRVGPECRVDAQGTIGGWVWRMSTG